MADGRVRVLYRQEHLGSGPDGELVRDLATGTVHTVHVSRRVVDARYQEPSIPATHTPSFEVADEAWVVPVNQLPAYAEGANRFTVLGSGKTAVDACLWLLEQRVDPDRIRWVRPRDAWFHDRSAFQPLELVAWTMEGISYDAEAAALASDTADLFDRLESSGRLFRIDPSRPAKMYRGTMLSTHELNLLRQIGDVVRLGAATRVTESRIHLQDGEVAASRGDLHVDCTARGLGDAPDVPIFGQQIVLQQVRHNSPTFNAAMIGFVEARRDSDTEKNRLCPPNRYASSVRDWAPMMRRTWRTEGNWLGSPISRPGSPTHGSTCSVGLRTTRPSRACRPRSSATSSMSVRQSSEQFPRSPSPDLGLSERCRAPAGQRDRTQCDDKPVQPVECPIPPRLRQDALKVLSFQLPPAGVAGADSSVRVSLRATRAAARSSSSDQSSRRFS